MSSTSKVPSYVLEGRLEPGLKFRGEGVSEGSFYNRQPSVEFKPPTPDWGYLAQVNEKFKTVITWDVERIVGEPAHRAMFQCTPVWNGEKLHEYSRTGGSKKIATNAAAEAIALSGHC